MAKPKRTVNKKRLLAFFRRYIDQHRSTYGMKLSAAKHFKVTPAAITYHVRRLADVPEFRRTFARISRAPELPMPAYRRVDRIRLLRILERYWEKHGHCIGVRAVAARELVVSEEAIKYNIKQMAKDPQLADKMITMLPKLHPRQARSHKPDS